MKEEYNWWTDPKNKEEVEFHSWWNHPENQTTVEIPIALAKSGEHWVATTGVKAEEQYLGEELHGLGSGDTKEEAIAKMFEYIRLMAFYYKDSELRYQRWVPFRKGPWGRIGGNWFSIFGLHVYFRYGKKMKYGWYIPFTKLNISFSSDWRVYKRWRKKHVKP